MSLRPFNSSLKWLLLFSPFFLKWQLRLTEVKSQLVSGTMSFLSLSPEPRVVVPGWPSSAFFFSHDEL